VAGRYAFIHALYRHVLYGRVSIGLRVGLHLRTAECLEAAYGDRAREIASELAVHFEHGRDFDRAALYRGQAGEHALHQHAYREAAEHATRGLASLRALPDSPERARRELALQVTRGAGLTATEGYSAPEVAGTYARAWELCTQVGETPQVLPVLRGLGRYYIIRGEFTTAREIGDRLLAIADARSDTTLRIMAHNALGIVSLYSGEFETALDHLESGFAMFDPVTHNPIQSALYRLVPPGVTCAIHAGWTLWMLGYAERAAARTQQALSLARMIGQPFGVSYACHLAAAIHRWRGEIEVVAALEEEALVPDAEHGFGLMLTAGVIQRGWLLAESGRSEEGLAQMLEGLAKHREMGAVVLVPAFLTVIAELYQKLGRPADGLTALSEALTVAQQSGQHYWESELHRLTGVLTLEADTRRGRGTAETLETHLQRAIEIARRQHAKWLELRATTNLARLWSEQGHLKKARTLLSGVHGWFTEGLDTPDLREARTLLDTLEA
jgi:predicted ATPase